jgi:DNA primase
MAMLSNAQRKSLERATKVYMQGLPKALPYLAGRGISPEAAAAAGLGVVVDPLPGHENRLGRLAIPYLTDAGPVNMTFRCIQFHDCGSLPNHKKYLTWPKLQNNLYHAQSIESAGEWLAVAEGEIDALTLNIAGIPAVGISGVDKWQEFWPLIFNDFIRLYFFEDGDDAGKKLGDRLMHDVDSPVIRIKMEDGEDVNSWYVKHGPQALREMIRQ